MAPNPEILTTIPSKLLFPVAYGNEEETGMMDDISGKMDEPYELAGNLERYVPKELQTAVEGTSLLFLKNGSKIYPGGAAHCSDTTNIERATAECSTPSQLALAVHASELLMVRTVKNYLECVSGEQMSDTRVTARVQRRVVDGQGNRKGCHDNFGIDTGMSLHADGLPPTFLAHVASRSLITGAGHVTNDGITFAQKIDGLESVARYGYVGSMFRVIQPDGTAPLHGSTRRLEVRCNDINISQWAIRMRLGGVALALAVAKTPAAKGLFETSYAEVINWAVRMNELRLNPDGTIRASKTLHKALDAQRKIADHGLQYLYRYTDEIPEEMEWTALETLSFCQDFKKVLTNEATIELLADRADWAAKLTHILKRLDRDKNAGKTRELTDVYSRAADLQYDYIGLSAVGGVLDTEVYGLGYRLRDKGHFRAHTKIADVEKLYHRAPTTTRAYLRGEILRHYPIVRCDWGEVVVRVGSGHEEFPLPDVDQTEFSKYDRKRLASIKQIS